MTKPIFNPLNSDFSVEYDINGDSHPETFTANAMAISYFDEGVWEHVRKHLVDHIMNVRELNPLIAKNRKDIINEVDVEL